MMKLGKYHGKGKQYDENGILRCSGEFRNGIRNGTCVCYDQRGYFICECEICDGGIHDDFVFFCMDNKPKYFGQFKHNKFINGVEFSYANNSVKIFSEEFNLEKE